jgi:sulfur relay (sulfurtransferase) DsrF/TusC family protein
MEHILLGVKSLSHAGSFCASRHHQSNTVERLDGNELLSLIALFQNARQFVVSEQFSSCNLAAWQFVVSETPIGDFPSVIPSMKFSYSSRGKPCCD